ncbi:MAG: sulfotransferase [Symploca sp. SIO2C1]|nr:sulfotransferase [Symploca sp. SIO2C1]
MNNYNLGAIFGTGRSGTTWLGAILQSHPAISYRFEPFTRLQKTQVEISQALELIQSDAFSVKELPSIYQALLPAYPECEKPPFFPKNYPVRFSWGKSLTWPLARKNALGSCLFRYLYTPKGQPKLVFKEVDKAKLLIPLLARTEMPIAYIVRHPCAVISSVMRGQNNSIMPSGRRSVLKNLLAKYEPMLAEQYGERLETLKLSEQEALLWLVEVGRSVSACQNSPNGLLVIYEELTERTLELTEKIFSHFGLNMAQESVSFIEESTSTSSAPRMKRGEIGINQYFTVFRDSKVSRDRWKQEMSTEDQQRVMKIVKNSPVFALAAEQGLWV